MKTNARTDWVITLRSPCYRNSKLSKASSAFTLWCMVGIGTFAALFHTPFIIVWNPTAMPQSCVS